MNLRIEPISVWSNERLPTIIGRGKNINISIYRQPSQVTSETFRQCIKIFHMVSSMSVHVYINV